MDKTQIAALIKQMVQTKKVGLFPRRLEDGNTVVVCPSCKATTPAGAEGMRAIVAGNHRDGCQLVGLLGAIEGGATDDEIVSRFTWLIRDSAVGLYGRTEKGSPVAVCAACGEVSAVGLRHDTYPLDAGSHKPDCEIVQAAEAIFS